MFRIPILQPRKLQHIAILKVGTRDVKKVDSILASMLPDEAYLINIINIINIIYAILNVRPISFVL